MSPVWAGSEWDSYPCCSACREEQDYVALTDEGRAWFRRRHDPPALAPYARSADGRLLRYAWPGGYPIAYVTGMGEVVCPDCADEIRERGEERAEDRPADGDVTWEVGGDDPEVDWPLCDDCGQRLEVAYPPDGYTSDGEPEPEPVAAEVGED